MPPKSIDSTQADWGCGPDCCILSLATKQEREALSRERVNNMLENQVSFNIDRIRLGANKAIQINTQAEQGEPHT
ncbi:hypothetical protein J3459_010355 [Metarhizium acridum]|nr:hypothetical protein J3459_010355 [Metarhizium acridum]